MFNVKSSKLNVVFSQKIKIHFLLLKCNMNAKKMSEHNFQLCCIFHFIVILLKHEVTLHPDN